MAISPSEECVRSGRRYVNLTLIMGLLISGFQLATEAAEKPLSTEERPIGWLGISIQEVSEELAERLAATFGVEAGTGVLVVESLRGGPAEAAGLRPNDVIVKLDHQPIWEVRQLQEIIRKSAPGRSIRLTVLREKHRVQVPVAIGLMPDVVWAQLAGERLGFSARARPGVLEKEEASGKPEGEQVWVVFVEPASPAAEAGLRPQDLLIRIGEHDIRSLQEMAVALRSGKPGERLSIQVLRNGEQHVVSLRVPPLGGGAESR